MLLGGVSQPVNPNLFGRVSRPSIESFGKLAMRSVSTLLLAY